MKRHFYPNRKLFIHISKYNDGEQGIRGIIGHFTNNLSIDCYCPYIKINKTKYNFNHTNGSHTFCDDIDFSIFSNNSEQNYCYLANSNFDNQNLKAIQTMKKLLRYCSIESIHKIYYILGVMYSGYYRDYFHKSTKPTEICYEKSYNIELAIDCIKKAIEYAPCTYISVLYDVLSVMYLYIGNEDMAIISYVKGNEIHSCKNAHLINYYGVHGLSDLSLIYMKKYGNLYNNHMELTKKYNKLVEENNTKI